MFSFCHRGVDSTLREFWKPSERALPSYTDRNVTFYCFCVQKNTKRSKVLITEKRHENKKAVQRDSRMFLCKRLLPGRYCYLSKQTKRSALRVLLLFVFSAAVLLSRACRRGCRKHSALKDLRNSAIVLNLNGVRGPSVQMAACAAWYAAQ